MANLTVSFSIDDNDHLILILPSVPTPRDPPTTLQVENGLSPGSSQVFDNFGGSADLGPAIPGVYLVTSVLNDADTSNAVVSISGLPGALSVNYGVATAATADAIGFDIGGQPPVSALSFFKTTDGFTFGLRYVSNPKAGSTRLSAAETGHFLDADIALMLVQHPPAGTWHPDPAQAATWATRAVNDATSACVPKGVTVFCDLEEVTGTPAQDVTDFFDSWSATVSAAGYVPGIYVGSNAVLDSDDLAALNFQIFWRACSKVPDITAGYNMVQSPCDEAHGDPDHPVNVDVDRIAAPGAMMWLKRQN